MSEFRKAIDQTPAEEVKTARPTHTEDGEKVENPLSFKGTPIIETKEDSLLATYEQDQGKPFVAEYFDAVGVWDKEPSLMRDLQEIEAYIRDKVEKNQIDNSTRAGKEFLKNLEREAGLTRYESTSTRIAKILAFIDFKKVVES